MQDPVVQEVSKKLNEVPLSAHLTFMRKVAVIGLLLIAATLIITVITRAKNE